MATKLYIKVFFILFLVVTFGCKTDKNSENKDSFKNIISFKKEGVLTLKQLRTDSIITELDIEIADTEYERQTGLMYRNSMENNQGMLFVFTKEDYQNFYMKNTRIPLDIIFINANKNIVSFQKNAQPFNESSLPSNAFAKYVLEVNAGLADIWQLKVGDKIAFKKL